MFGQKRKRRETIVNALWVVVALFADAQRGNAITKYVGYASWHAICFVPHAGRGHVIIESTSAERTDRGKVVAIVIARASGPLLLST